MTALEGARFGETPRFWESGNTGQLAGEKIQRIVTRAPGNKVAIGGLKVVTANGWFAARPSGTEAIYKIYAESFRGAEHLRHILAEAQAIVEAAVTSSPPRFP